MFRTLKLCPIVFPLLGSQAIAAPSTPTPIDTFLKHALSGSEWDSFRYLLSLKQGMEAEAETQVLSTPCWVDHTSPDGSIAFVDCPSNATDTHWIETLANLPSVRWVDANYHLSLTAPPNDLHPNQWYLDNIGQKIGGIDGIVGADISSIEAWGVQVGSAEVIVAIPDTGIYLPHVELQNNIWTNPGELCLNGVDDDGNGYIDDCNGWDFADNDPDVSPLNINAESGCPKGHGTFIAGLIGADTVNDMGIAGLNWNIKMMPLKIASDESCSIKVSGLLDAIYYARDNGAQIVSTSFAFTEYVETLEMAFAAASEAGLFVTLSAGNQGVDVNKVESYPVDFEHSGTLVVGASNNRDEATAFTNFGTPVDLFGPGQALLSLGIGQPNQLVTSSGTSYAAPLVAGTAGLLLAEHPELRASQIAHAIRNSVDLIPTFDCTDNEVCAGTGGRLNAFEALLTTDAMTTGPYIALDSLQIMDQVGEAPGDSDGVLERGEVANVFVKAVNHGVSSTTSLRVTIDIVHPHLKMSSNLVNFNPIASEDIQTSTDSVRVSLSRECLKDSHAKVDVLFEETSTGIQWTDVLWYPLKCEVDDDQDGHLYPEDCDDLNPDIHPSAIETCNGYDDNCDTIIDGLGADGSSILYQDEDGDTYGNPAVHLAGCLGTAGWSDNALDCDDTNSFVYAGANEICDKLDNDCDIDVDEEAINPTRWYMDRDDDGLGDPQRVTLACDAPAQHVANDADCDDASLKSCETKGGCQSVRAYVPTSLLFWIMSFLWIRKRPQK